MSTISRVSKLVLIIVSIAGFFMAVGLLEALGVTDMISLMNAVLLVTGIGLPLFGLGYAFWDIWRAARRKRAAG